MEVFLGILIILFDLVLFCTGHWIIGGFLALFILMAMASECE